MIFFSSRKDKFSRFRTRFTVNTLSVNYHMRRSVIGFLYSSSYPKLLNGIRTSSKSFYFFYHWTTFSSSTCFQQLTLEIIQNVRCQNSLRSKSIEKLINNGQLEPSKCHYKKDIYITDNSLNRTVDPSIRCLY